MLRVPLQPRRVIPTAPACFPLPADRRELPPAGAAPQTAQAHAQQHALTAGFQPLSLQFSSFISS